MPLSNADTKVLWSNAAGLCSFPDCKELLVRFSKGKDGFYHLGEMAHLTARSIKGPRGKGLLSSKARDRVENHILLCPKCHTIIDKDPDEFPIELLLQFKLAHEGWVAETLHLNLEKRSSFLDFYFDLLKTMEHILLFDRWTWMIDHLWRDLSPSEVIESGAKVRMILLKTIWPGTIPKLEKAMIQTLQYWSDLCLHFASGARYRDGDAAFMISDHFYKGMSLEERFRAERKQEKWSNGNGQRIFTYVASLNHLVNVVRATLSPAYRQDFGHFIIPDELGYRNNGHSVYTKPHSIEPSSKKKAVQRKERARRKYSPK
jgi:hypothetical protein